MIVREPEATPRPGSAAIDKGVFDGVELHGSWTRSGEGSLPEFVAGMNGFARDVGILKGNPCYEDVVAAPPAALAGNCAHACTISPTSFAWPTWMLRSKAHRGCRPSSSCCAP